jgi:hypothetical protein
MRFGADLKVSRSSAALMQLCESDGNRRVEPAAKIKRSALTAGMHCCATGAAFLRCRRLTMMWWAGPRRQCLCRGSPPPHGAGDDIVLDSSSSSENKNWNRFCIKNKIILIYRINKWKQ